MDPLSNPVLIEKAAEAASEITQGSRKELSAFFGDVVRGWRLERQVKVLKKSVKKVKEAGFTPRQINLKMLVPLLDKASLEDEEIMEDAWATLLTNMLDPEEHFDNHVFPHILGQISTYEYELLMAFWSAPVDGKYRFGGKIVDLPQVARIVKRENRRNQSSDFIIASTDDIQRVNLKRLGIIDSEDNIRDQLLMINNHLNAKFLGNFDHIPFNSKREIFTFTEFGYKFIQALYKRSGFDN